MIKKTVLVTGASGFVGRPLIDQLHRAGYLIRATTRDATPFHNYVTPVTIPDLSTEVNWKPILEGIDIVIHIAGVTHIDIQKNASRMFDLVNRLATQNLVRAAKEGQIERFVYISSLRAQVGPTAKLPVREADDARPTDDYGRSKLAAENAVRESGVPFTILRPVFVYGPHPIQNFKSLIRLAASPLPLPFLGLSGRRSLLCVDNFVSATLFVLNNPATAGETYLIADDSSFTLAEIVTMMRKAQGRHAGLFKIHPWLFRLALGLFNQSERVTRLGEDLVVDTTKLKMLGWLPPISTYDGIAAMMRAESKDI